MGDADPSGPPLGRPLACCVEAPPSYLAKARYAVEMLLLGLGFAPRWVDRDGLSGGGLYYGLQAEEAPLAATRIRLDPATVAFFETPRPFDPARVGQLDWDGRAWPLVFDGGDGVGEKDVVASAFFWLSGWDEAATTARDRHGRFACDHSLLGRLAPDLPPLVDVYRQWLGERLVEQGLAVPGRSWGGKRWSLALSVDVDVVRTRRLGVLARGLAAGRPGAALRALAPGDARWDALAALKDAAEARGARATWYFKAGAATPQDVGYRLEASRLRRFVAGLQADGHEVGLHPSYAAYDHPGRLVAERDRLARLLGAPPRLVRTHFLRWAAPTTPRLLARAGFRLDGTLGFATRPGFRRATAAPFRLYDLSADRPLDLWELPLAVMDTTLLSHMHLSGGGAEAAAAEVCAAARRVGGCAVLLWHNVETDADRAEARLDVLSRLLDQALADGAALTAMGEAVAGWHPGGRTGT